ncbi:MAG: YchJ family metal-binding protein [Sporichthyaceae bacterium]
MNRPLRDDDCPCGSGGSFGSCCGPVLEGTAAPTAQALMRSRYTAYAVGDPAHLFRSWHPRTRPDDVVLDVDLRWEGLEVLSVVGGGAVTTPARWSSSRAPAGATAWW